MVLTTKLKPGCVAREGQGRAKHRLADRGVRPDLKAATLHGLHEFNFVLRRINGVEGAACRRNQYLAVGRGYGTPPNPLKQFDAVARLKRETVWLRPNG